jgi:3D (Asp-Asp-Asp) domain-containing protein
MRGYVFPEELRWWKRMAAVGILAGVIASLGAVVVFVTLKDRPEDQAIRDIGQQLGLIQDQVTHLSDRRTARVTVTCYNSRINQTDSTPRITAINTSCREGTVAVSRDLLEQGWTFGRKVWIEGHGVFVIEDVMAKSKARQLDIWQPGKARIFRQDNVLAVVLR